MDGVAMNYTVRKPAGIAGLISPWNLPLYLLSWKIAPALAGTFYTVILTNSGMLRNLQAIRIHFGHSMETLFVV